jgi:hypothetical protein
MDQDQLIHLRALAMSSPEQFIRIWAAEQLVKVNVNRGDAGHFAEGDGYGSKRPPAEVAGDGKSTDKRVAQHASNLHADLLPAAHGGSVASISHSGRTSEVSARVSADSFDTIKDHLTDRAFVHQGTTGTLADSEESTFNHPDGTVATVVRSQLVAGKHLPVHVKARFERS